MEEWKERQKKYIGLDLKTHFKQLIGFVEKFERLIIRFAQCQSSQSCPFLEGDVMNVFDTWLDGGNVRNLSQ